MKIIELSYYTSLFLLILCTGNIKSQTQVTDFFNYGLSNAQVLSEPFLEPYAGIVDASLTSGWNMSPRVLRAGRFSIHCFYNQSFSGGTKLIDLAKMIANQDLKGVTLQDPDVYRAPTAVYKYPDIQERPILDYNGQATVMPNGEDMKSLYIPVITATIGTSFNTDISIRLTPPIDYTYLGKTLMWGAGIKHSLVPYFRFMQKHPFLETSVMLTYSQLSSSTELSYQDQNGQSLDIAGTTITGRFLLGAHFNVVDLFGSVGYGNRTSSVILKGEYANIPGQTASITDPLSHDYDFSDMEYEAGVQVRIYFINLQASYSYSKFSMVSIGAGISFH